MEGWKKVVDAVHSEGSAFAVQVSFKDRHNI